MRGRITRSIPGLAGQAKQRTPSVVSHVDIFCLSHPDEAPVPSQTETALLPNGPAFAWMGWQY